MSYILDALRKVERERPRLVANRFRILPVEQARRWGLWALGGVLLANALLLSVLFRSVWWPALPSETGPGQIPGAAPAPAASEGLSQDGHPPSQPAVGADVAAPPQDTPTGAPVSPSSPARAARIQVPGDAAGKAISPVERARPPSPPSSTASTGGRDATPPVTRDTPPGVRGGVVAPAAGAPVAAPSPEASAPGPTPVTQPAAPAAAPAPTVFPPPVSTAGSPQTTPGPAQPAPVAEPAPAGGSATGGQGLTLDVLVYSDTPSERLVFINGRKYVEGQRTEQGLVVEAITPQGAMLNDQGRRFLLEAAGTQ